uniref:Uncharacterized protein n=1 Tax=Alexandrium monilatum TaxID=311494 RepID=A0A7S4UFD6_9DINO
MGTGAIAGFSTAARQVKPEDLRNALGGVDAAQRARMAAALQSLDAQASAASGGSAGAVDTGDGGAGGAEITGDDELAFELNQQELLFQKCMRARMEREAKLKLQRQQKKEADEKKRRDALENAFDGELDKLLQFFSDGFPIETADGYGTTLLSEAAAGGAEDCIAMLLGNGANVNKRGRNMRTPLWRAANAGHSGAVQMLLRAGGDPRTPDEIGAKPYHVANGVEVKTLLECWDVSITEKLVTTMAANQKKIEREKKAKEKKQKEEMQDALEQTQRKTQIARTEVARIQKMVVSYRQQKVSLAETGEVEKMKELEPLLENAEAELATAKKVHQELEWQVRRAKLKVRDFENKLRRLARKAGEEVSLIDQVIWLKDLSDVVVRDVGGKRREDGRWPMVFDPSGKSVTFFSYSGAAQFDADLLSTLMASDQKEEQRRLLLALLKHLKYGGVLAISLGDDFAKLAQVEDAFNFIEKGLFNTLLDRSVLFSYLLPRRFLNLVPADLQNEYSELMFDDEMLGKFVLTFVLVGEEPEKEVMEKEGHQFYTIKVNDPDAKAEEDDGEA